MGIGAVVPDGSAANPDIGKLKILNRIFNIRSSKLVDKFKVGIGNTTPASTDTDLETRVGNPTYNVVTGYPIIDEAAQKVTIRGQLSSGDANSNTIVEMSWADEDGNVLSREVFDGISKKSTDEIAFVGEFRIVDET